MHRKEVKIINESGLHARPAAEFCRIASQFNSEILITRMGDEERHGNAKSVISVVSMMVEKGMNLLITAEGNDEMIAVETLAALVNNGFGE
ncbi:HPr family phosphocarrier protein [Eubacteriaceae bacterium ES3]|nr:HPr family phosphocarrier protein [Eubacteriaceae bacterium ES3]